MSKKLVYLVCFIFVLGLGGAVHGAFDTVGVYDPDDEPHHNQVDQSGTYDSHTGNAGPENVIVLTTFQTLIGPAFNADAGGVLNAESESGGLDGQDIIANFGVNKTKSVTISSTSGTIHRGSGGSSGNRLPTSGDGRFAKSNTGDFVFDISPVTGGAPDEVIIYFAGTLLYRDNRDMNPQVTVTFSGGGTVTAIADMAMDAPSSSKDTFFGFVAPPGEGIVNVTFDLAGYTNLDDMAFITSAFVVLSKEASVPSPAKGMADVPRDVTLIWTAGEYTDKHDVYFGTDEQAVDDADTSDNTGIYRGRQDPNTYAPGRLEFDQTYYWRVDEVNAPPDSTIFKGDIWSFTTEPIAYAVENITATASSNDADKGPENTVNSSGLDDSGLLHGNEGVNAMWLSNRDGTQPTWIEYEFDNVYKLHKMWVWNSNESLEPMIGLGFKDVSIDYSVNGTDYTTLDTTHEFARASGTPNYAHNTTVDFSGVAGKYVRLTANSNWGGILDQFGLSEVRFFSIPVQARGPNPASGATDVGLDLVLGFRAGREAAKHDVYFSDDWQAVVDGTAPVTTVTDTSHGPLALDLGSTYYWRVDEVNDAETPTTWQGDVWNFTTHEYFVVDDFEDYNDYSPDEIFSMWIDGYGTTTNGSTAGYPEPDFLAGEHYIETTIVHSGDQSMPLFYDNNFKYSEAAMTLSSQRDWTIRGVGVLSLWFYGDTSNAAERMYVALNGSAVVYHDEPSAAQIATWTEWRIDLQEFAAQGVNLANVNTITIGFGDKNNLQAGGSGMVFFDDIRLYRSAP